MLIGLISDTHGLLREEALAALRGSELILHAGDIGGAEIVERLAQLAPVLAVRGNNDKEPWAQVLPESRLLELQGQRVLLLHDRKQLLQLHPSGADVVISGHSHKPLVEQRGDTLFVNPGSAGPRRFQLPIALARLRLEGGRASAEIVTLA